MRRKSQALVPVVNGQILEAQKVDAFIWEWVEYMESEKSANTAKTYAYAMAKFRDYLNEVGVGFVEVVPSVVRGWRDTLQQAYARATVNAWLTGLRRFYEWVRVEKDIPLVNPAAGVSAKGKEANGLKRDDLHSAEVLALFEACDDGSPAGKRDKAIFAIMAYSGARTNEVRLANMKDLKSKGQHRVLFVQGKGHTEKDAYVLITHQADEALRDWFTHRGNGSGPIFTSLSNRSKGSRLTSRSMRLIWENRSKQAGIAGGNKSLHSLRHTAITNAIRHGADLLRVQQMARHTDINTTKRFYVHVDRLDNPAELTINYENGV